MLMIVSENKIIEYNEKGITKALCLGVSIKSYHRNSVVYNYKHRDMHIKWGLSRQTYNKYVRILVANGDAKISGKNLQILNLCKNTKGGRVLLNKRDIRKKNINELAIDMNGKLFLSIAKRQQYVVNLKIRSTERQKSKTMQDLKSAISAEKKLDRIGLGKSLNGQQLKNGEVTYSYDTIAEKTGLSRVKAVNTIKHLKNIGSISITNNSKYLGKQQSTGYSYSPSKNVIVTKQGNAYYVDSNTYAILQ